MIRGRRVVSRAVVIPLCGVVVFFAGTIPSIASFIPAYATNNDSHGWLPEFVETGDARRRRITEPLTVRKERFSSTRLLTLVAPLVFLSAALPGRSAQAADISSSVRPVVVTAKAERSGPSCIRLAEDVTRRLRRMGINIIKTRLERPYDPEGELC